MILNLGPQHPATHGTLRLVVRLDGERVVAADPVIGYMHRGYEKLTEFRTYPQITTLINRIDWLSSFANEVPFIDAAEQLMGIEAPPRAQYIRTILTELSRIATFVLFLGEMGLQVGALTPAFYGFRDREHVLNLIEARDRRALPPQLQPHRRHQGRPAVGLDQRDPHGDEDASSTRATRSRTSSPATRSSRPAPARIGIIPAELGAAYGVSGSNLRASGVDWDLRRDGKPYLVVPRPRLQGLDAPRRRLVRPLLGAAAGDRVSRRAWCCSCSTQMPAGPIMAKVPRIIKVPEGEVWVETENPLGQMGYYVVSKGATGPFRVKIRSASFSNVSILPWLLRGVFVPDVDHDPRRRSTSSSGTSTGDAHVTARARDRLGHHARDQDDRHPDDHPARRADPRLRVPAQDDEPHAEPARSDGPRRLPRLVPARGRRHQVHPEGRHHAGARPTGACSRSRRRSS